MAKSNAIAGMGTVFNRWDETTSAFVPISEISAIPGPSKTKDTIEVTHLTSPDGYREYIGGLKDGGELALTMNYTAATYEVMNGDFESPDAHQYQIVLPDGMEFEFEAICTDISVGIDVGDKVSADTSLKITGKVLDNASSL